MLNAMRFLAIAVLLATGAISAFAADITGSWAITVETPNGKRDAVVDFKQDGEKLTGTMKGQAGDAPLTGAVKGNDVTFSITREFNGDSIKIDYAGKVDGTKMTGTLNFGGQGDATFTAEKK